MIVVAQTLIDPGLQAAIDAEIAAIQLEQIAEHKDAIRAKSAVKRQQDHSDSIAARMTSLADLWAQAKGS